MLVEPIAVVTVGRDLAVRRAEEERLAVLDDDGVADATDRRGLVVAQDLVLAIARRGARPARLVGILVSGRGRRRSGLVRRRGRRCPRGGSLGAHRSDHLADLVAEGVPSDLESLRLAAENRFGEVGRLLAGDRRPASAARAGRRRPRSSTGRAERTPLPRRSRNPAGSSIVMPMPPQASANLTKSIGWSSTPYSGLPRKTICSHLIWPSMLFLMTTTLIGSSYLTAVANSRHQHREAAVADEGDDLPVGIGDLGRDRRRAGRRPSSPGCPSRRTSCPRRISDVPRRPGRDRARVGRDDRVVGEQVVDDARPRPAASSACRALARARRISSHHSFIASWAFSRNERARARPEQRQQGLERRRGVADEADVDRVAEPDPGGVAVDLDGPRLAGLRDRTPCRGS